MAKTPHQSGANYEKTHLSQQHCPTLSACQQTEQKADQTTHDGEVVSTEHAHEHAAHGDAHGHDGHGHHEHVELPVADTPAPALEESVYLVEGDWKDQDGNAFDLNSLAGQKQVVAFIFTNCKEVCPFMMRSMKTFKTNCLKRCVPTQDFWW